MPLNFNAPELAEWRNAWGSPESEGSGGRSFEQWLKDHIRESGDQRAAQILADQLGEGDLPPNEQEWAQVVAGALPEVYGTVGGGEPETVPLEQGLLETTMPSLVADVENDAQRRTIADELGQNTLAGANAATAQLARTQGGRFDGQTYFRNNPDVAAEYERQRQADPALDANTFAEQHYLNNGQREGRQPAYIQSAQMAQDFANADQITSANIAASDQATQAQLAALAEASAQMQQNLSGEQAARAAALQQQIAAFQENLGQYDTAQRAAILQQMATEQTNLEEAITAQEGAVGTEAEALRTASSEQAQAQLAALAQTVAQLRGNLAGESAQRAAALEQQINALLQNLDQLDATQRAALTEQITSQQANLEQSITTQRQALTEQIAALGTAADAQSAAQRTALQQELAGLTAAQQPLAAARLQAAELQATAVNVGLERTKDQLTAQAAEQGYVGGSTAQNAALARATVDARQRAAEAVGGARVANAADLRDIGVRGATGERTIAEQLAAARNQIAGQGATGNAALTVGGALGRQSLADQLAAGTAGIAGSTAVSRAAIGAQGANTTFADALNAAAQGRTIGDNAAAFEQQIATDLAARGFTIGSNEAAAIRDLANRRAEGRQNIGNNAAAATGALASNVATQQQALGNAGATQAYTDTTTGAGQSRSIADQLAQGGYSLTAANALNALQARREGNAARGTYYDNDYARRLNASLAMPAIAGATANTLTGLDDFATSGLTRTQGLLDWWSTPNTQAPTPGAVAVQPDTSGNAWAQVGAGLVNTGLNIGNANDWWRRPGTGTANPNSPTGYTTPGGNVGVQTDWTD